MLSHDALGLMDGLSEAVVVVLPNGMIAGANRAAAQLLGPGVVGRVLLDLVVNDRETAATLLQRCLGSSGPLMGALNLQTDKGVAHLQCRGNRISLASGPALFLRFLRGEDDRFGPLTRKVNELNAEITERKHGQAVLQETLREREVLMRELQHRVKNNMQMLAGMLLGAAREASSPEAQAALRDAATRFSAVSAVQQLLYGSSTLETVSSEALVESLVKGTLALPNPDLEASSRVDPLDLPVDPAITIALVLTELLVNAKKHGKPAEGRQRVAVAFSTERGETAIEVRDNGPGFQGVEVVRRASGLGLVRALLRQLDGRLELANDNGARCTAAFRIPSVRKVLV